VVENLGLAGSGVGDEGLIEDIEDVLADLLELRLDLVAVVADGGDVLVGALGLLLLLDRRDNAPAGAAGANDVLVGDREEVALVDGKLATELGNLLHVANHFIIALGLLAKAGEESLAVGLFKLWSASLRTGGNGGVTAAVARVGRKLVYTPLALHGKNRR